MANQAPNAVYDKSKNDVAQNAKRFLDRLLALKSHADNESLVPLPSQVVFVDEAFTSDLFRVHVEPRRDALSAMAILQYYLDDLGRAINADAQG